MPSPINPPQGCRFHPRCAHAREICRVQEPAFVEAAAGHGVACHLWKDLERTQ